MRPAVRRRPGLSLLLTSALLAAPAEAAPSFVPSPRQAFEGFVAINAPRPDVPVGALWIDGYGPTGEAATPDNLETVRSLTGVTIDRGLQLSLTIGLFNMLGIEPRLRDHYTARFTDLTIVRVKDIARLTGPKGEPRIFEALKAGSVIVSTDGEMGLNGRTLGWQLRNFEATTANGRTRNYAIEGRDMFVAVRVVTPKLVAGKERELDIAQAANKASARIGDYLVVMDGGNCSPAADRQCIPASAGVIKLNSYAISAPAEQMALDSNATARIGLPVPVADEMGGLFDALIVRWIAPCAIRNKPQCGKRPRLFAHFEGTRLEDLRSPHGKGW